MVCAHVYVHLLERGRESVSFVGRGIESPNWKRRRNKSGKVQKWKSFRYIVAIFKQHCVFGNSVLDDACAIHISAISQSRNLAIAFVISFEKARVATTVTATATVTTVTTVGDSSFSSSFSSHQRQVHETTRGSRSVSQSVGRLLSDTVNARRTRQRNQCRRIDAHRRYFAKGSRREVKRITERRATRE